MLNKTPSHEQGPRTGPQGERLLSAVDLHAVISITDPQGRITYVNDLFCAASGYAREELIGQTHRLLKSGVHPPALYAEIWQHIRAGKPWQGEICNRNRNGKRYWVRTIIVPFLDAQGNPIEYISVRTDITAIKEAELLMARARDEAATANQAKSTFLANISHEMRTPMNAIMGLSHLCLQTPLSEQQRAYIDKTHRAASVLLGIIDDILDFSSIEAGRLALQSSAFSIRELLANVLSPFATAARDRGLEFHIHYDESLPHTVMGDPLRIGQVMTNLVSNALKFTEEGQIDIRVEACEKGPDETLLLHFSVSDTGIGITSVDQAFLFEAFHQADNSLTRKYGGTGLGLAISHRLVSLMEGHLSVQSTLGKGSTFAFTVRCRLPEDTATEAGTENAPRILLVEDESVSRKLMTLMLEKLGCIALVADSGHAALTLLANATRPIQLALIDRIMAGMNGQETALAIRTLPGYENLPIIMVTAAQHEDLDRLDQRGFNDCLVKPVHYGLLQKTLKTWLQSPSRGPEREPIRLQGRRVLLVEDTLFNQEVAKGLLAADGLVVEMAENGQEALEWLEKAAFELVFMDMQMPVMDGLSATRAIRAQPRFAALPIIAMTANALPEDRARCFEAGMNDFLAKPIDPQKLHALLLQWLPSAASPPPTVPTASPLPPNPSPLSLADAGNTPPSFSAFNCEQGLFYATGNPAVYLKLLGVFESTLPRLLQGLETALAGDTDRAQAARHAHSIKGMVATLGAETLAATAAALEKELKNPAACPTQGPEALPAFYAALKAAQEELPRLKAHLAPS